MCLCVRVHLHTCGSQMTSCFVPRCCPPFHCCCLFGLFETRPVTDLEFVSACPELGLQLYCTIVPVILFVCLSVCLSIGFGACVQAGTFLDELPLQPLLFNFNEVCVYLHICYTLFQNMVLLNLSCYGTLQQI